MYDWLIAQIGADSARVVTVIVAFLVAAVVVWLIISLSRRAQSRSANGEHKSRLALCASMAVDAQRRVVIIRRDGVEHLLLIGGPSDVVIESKIPIASLAPVTHTVLDDRHEDLAHGVVDEDAAIGFMREDEARGADIAASTVMAPDDISTDSPLSHSLSDSLEKEEALREAALREAVEREVQAAELRKMEAAAALSAEVQADIAPEMTVESQEAQAQAQEAQLPAEEEVTASQSLPVMPQAPLSQSPLSALPLSASPLSASPLSAATLSSLPLSSLMPEQAVTDPVYQDTQAPSIHNIAAQHGTQASGMGEEVAQDSASVTMMGLTSSETHREESALQEATDIQEATGIVEQEPPFSSYFAGQPKQQAIPHETKRPNAVHLMASQNQRAQASAALAPQSHTQAQAREQVQRQAQTQPQEQNHMQAQTQPQDQSHGQVARLVPVSSSPLSASALSSPTLSLATLSSPLVQTPILSSSPLLSPSVAAAAGGHEAAAEKNQDINLNPFVQPSAARAPATATTMATQQRSVAHGAAVQPSSSEPPAAPYANSFLGYPVQHFADSSLPTAGTPQTDGMVDTRMAAGRNTGMAPASTLDARREAFAAAAPHLYPVDSTPPPQPEETLMPAQNLADDFEQMLHDELMRPVDDGLKIVSFKP